MEKKKIVVLAGGTSSEREVSLVTGKGVYTALKSKGHQVVLIDVYLGYEGEKADDIFSVDKDWTEGIRSLDSKIPDLEEFKRLRKGDDKCFFGPNVLKICEQADVVFMALHGANGEDGRIQAVFELFGIPYTGTDYLSSGMCMDKAITKQIFDANGIPNAKGYSINIGEELEDIGYPVVVKVNTGGSSVGVYIVNNDKEMQDALVQAKAFDDRVVIEQFIKGREFTCGVIDGKALPIVEIAPKEGFYDFSNKYQTGATKDICPAVLEQEYTEKIQRYAEKAAEALRVKSYCRVDFILSEDKEIYCLEVNTLPGMTPTSLLPQEAAALGIDYPSLCEKLIEVSFNA